MIKGPDSKKDDRPRSQPAEQTQSATSSPRWTGCLKDLLIPSAVVVISTVGWAITKGKNDADLKLATLNAEIAQQNAKTAQLTLDATRDKNAADVKVAEQNAKIGQMTLDMTRAKNQADVQIALQNAKTAQLTLDATRNKNDSEIKIASNNLAATDRKNTSDRIVQSAQVVKELVPIVADSKQDMAVRVQVLVSLVETQSISDRSAFLLTNRLLWDGLVRADYPVLLMWNRKHPLLDALLARMPGGLEIFLEQYLVSMPPRDEKTRTHGTEASDVEAFWSELFYRALNSKRGTKLEALDSDSFLTEYLGAMDHLLERATPDQRRKLGKEWLARPEKGLRILAALQSVGDVGIRQHAANLNYLLSLVAPSLVSDANLRLADELITMQRLKGWASQKLFSKCVDLFVDGDKDMRRNSEAFNRAIAASGYIDWYGGAHGDRSHSVSRDPWNSVPLGKTVESWADIQMQLIRGLSRYMGNIRGATISENDFGPVVSRLSIARPLVEALVTNVEQGAVPSDSTRKVLDSIFALKDTRLKSLLLTDLRKRWIAVTDKVH